MKREKDQDALTLDKELQVTKECWEIVFPGEVTRPPPNCFPNTKCLTLNSYTQKELYNYFICVLSLSILIFLLYEFHSYLPWSLDKILSAESPNLATVTKWHL